MRDKSLAHTIPYVYRAEVAAYEVVAKAAELQRITPHYYGTLVVTDVQDRRGHSLRSRYWLDCAYEIERIPRDPLERKFGSFFQSPEWPVLEPIEQLFEAAGIRHLGDASVMHWGSSRPILIDFAISDAAGDHWRHS